VSLASEGGENTEHAIASCLGFIKNECQ